ncbi:MAG: transketolase [Candidatus Buchananbacteria bacterium]|nr:transketolase [Candidatus Buchananbacteria bacterium]
MSKLFFVPTSEINRIKENISDNIALVGVLANIFRINTLSMIKEAGSGHVGTSFSCLDIMTWLFTKEMKADDVYFSSKGHDAPGLYAVLIGLGQLDYEFIHKLRRLNGLPGHPDVGTPHIQANTGSLGMGISKARGMAIANRLNGVSSKIFVLSGDGELQEGQIWESLQPTANGKFGEITLIVDHNKIQSDIFVKDVSDLGELEKKFAAFGWEVARCDGHDIAALKNIFEKFNIITDRPKVLIADTVKGKGVGLMEGERGFADGLYKFHSGAPSDEIYSVAITELIGKVNDTLRALNLDQLRLESNELMPRTSPTNPQRLVASFSDALVKLGEENENIVALDGDLALDCGLLPFKAKYPSRFIECGIAEQDMVSAAGGLALKGKLPIVNSFACFLSTRPNEQIYNNATEKTKIIYVGSLAGLLPSGPGHSHQSVRDVSILGSIPGLTMIQPSCETETALALEWAVKQNNSSSYLRLVSIPVAVPYQLPPDYVLTKGRGVKLIEGSQAIIFAYGPVMLAQAYQAAIKLKQEDGLSVAVINLPWLNEIDQAWLEEITAKFEKVFSIDDHYVKFGQGALLSQVLGKKITYLGLTEIPKCGWNDEVLAYHGLDAQGIAKTIRATLQ